MVDHELIERVTRLPVSQRLELIELLTHSLREELVERLALSYNLDVPPDSSLHRILGVVPSGAGSSTRSRHTSA